MDVFELAASPVHYSIPESAMFNMIQSGAGYGFAIANDTGSRVTITGLTIEDDPDHLLFFYVPAPPIPTPECTVGLALDSGGRCYVWVASTVHW
jgi:hypothetical protein